MEGVLCKNYFLFSRDIAQVICHLEISVKTLEIPADKYFTVIFTINKSFLQEIIYLKGKNGLKRILPEFYRKIRQYELEGCYA
jgi:hypothetical protein